MKTLALFTAVVLATLTVVVLLWLFRSVVVLFLLSLVTAATVRPGIERLTGRGLPVAASLLMIYLLGLGVLGLLVYVLGAPLNAEFEQISESLVFGYERLVVEWRVGTAFQQGLVAQLPAPNEVYEAIAGEQGTALVGGVLGVTLGFFDIVANILAVLLLSVYWSAERVRFERLWLSLLSPEGRSRALEIWRTIEAGVGAYIRSELIQSLVAGILLSAGYWLIGLPVPLTLALFAAFAWLLPWVGVLFAMVPALLVGLLTSLQAGILAGLYTLAVLTFLEVAVEPRFFVRRRFSSLLVVLVVLALTDLYGIVGLILALPLSAALQIFFGNILRAQSAPAEAEPESRVARLQERLESVHAMIGALEEPPPREVASLVDRSARLIEETHRALQPPRSLLPSRTERPSLPAS